MKEIFKKNLLIFFMILFVNLWVFGKLSSTFFQQDEWHALGHIKTKGLSYLFTGASFFENLALDSRPLARILNLIFFGGFSLNIFPLFIFTVTVHTLNTFLIYLISRHLTKNNFWSFIASLFFTFNSTAKQAVLWFGTVTGTLPIGTMILLSILFYLKYLDKKQQKHLRIAIISLFVSLGFKENGLFLFVFFPLLYLIYNYGSLKRSKKIRFPHHIFLLAGIGLIFFLAKFLSIIFNPVASESRYITGASSTSIFKIIWVAVTYPFEGLAQISLSGEILFPFSKYIARTIFPRLEETDFFGYISEVVMTEFVSSLMAGLIIIFLTITLIFIYQKKHKKAYLFTASFYLLSFIPYFLSLKPNGYLESRCYYVSVIPIAILLGLLFNNFSIFLSRVFKQKVSIFIIKTALVLLFSTYLKVNINFIQENLDFLIERAGVQKYILSEILKSHPNFSQNQIFYIESDHSFIVPNNPLPFQNGIGYTLLVLYAYEKDVQNLEPFLEDRFFWMLGNQGYLKSDKTGFGFITTMEELKRVLKEEKLNPEDVTAFYYRSEVNKLNNTTEEIRAKLRQ